MGDFRTRYGRALGGIGSGLTVDLRGVAVAPENLAKPDVTNVSLLYTSNSTATAITDFALQSTTRSADYEGKILDVVFMDSLTRLVNSGNLKLAGTDGLQGPNSYVSLVYHNSSWVERFRSRSFSDYAQVGSQSAFTPSIIYASQTGVDVRGKSFISVFAAASSRADINMFINGEMGQRVVLYAANSEFPILINSGGFWGGTSAGFLATSTGGSRLNVASNATVSFRYTGTYWVEER